LKTFFALSETSCSFGNINASCLPHPKSSPFLELHSHIMCFTHLNSHGVLIQFVRSIYLFCPFFSLWSFCNCVDHDSHSFNLLVIFINWTHCFFVLSFYITCTFLCWWWFLQIISHVYPTRHILQHKPSINEKETNVPWVFWFVKFQGLL
jgi:hypothetical protein